MAKYRIRVESLDPAAEELRAEYRMGIDCDRFCILADTGEKILCCMHDVSKVDLAAMIAGCSEATEAAIMAKAMYEAREYARRTRSDRLAAALMGKLSGEGDEA